MSDQDYKTLKIVAKNIVELRRVQGMTQEALAFEAGDIIVEVPGEVV